MRIGGAAKLIADYPNHFFAFCFIKHQVDKIMTFFTLPFSVKPAGSNYVMLRIANFGKSFSGEF